LGREREGGGGDEGSDGERLDHGEACWWLVVVVAGKLQNG
jgi:hypothetical protein